MDMKERALLAGQATFIYLFKEIASSNIIYVGCTRYMGRRLTEHKGAINDPKNYAGIYVYMRENNLKLFEDVEIVIVEYMQDREKAQLRETALIEQYAATVKNNVKYDTRKYITDPRFLKVQCTNTGTIYPCVKSVMEELNITRYKLDKAMKEGKAINGNTFIYVKK